MGAHVAARRTDLRATELNLSGVAPMRDLRQLLAAGRREWSDDLEAVSGILGAAGVWDRAVGKRRQFARALLRRKVTPCDVLTWAVHAMQHGHDAGWLVRALEADPEVVFKARGRGAQPMIAGTVNHLRSGQVSSLVQQVLDAMHQRASLRAPKNASEQLEQRRQA